MIFLCDSTNKVTPIFGNTLKQGEIYANEILFLAPYTPRYTTVSLRVQLPNGIIIPSEPQMYILKPIDEAEAGELNLKLGTVALNAWRMRIDAAITQYAGAVSFQWTIAVSGADDGTLPAVYTTTTVVENVPRGVPSIPSGTSYDPPLINVYNAAIQAIEEAGETRADSVPLMTILDQMMFEKFGGTYNGVTYDNPDYYFSPTNWEVLLRCNRAYVQAYDADNDLRLGKDGKGLYCLTALLRYGGITFTSSEGIAVDVQVPRYPWMRKDKWVETYRVQNPDSELSDEEIMTDYPPAWTDYPFMSTICERRPDGRIRIPRTFAGLSDAEARQLAAPKDYVDEMAAEAVENANKYTSENFAPKLNPEKGNTYAYCYNGAGVELPIIIGANTPLPDSIVRRNNNGVIVTETSGEATDAVNVSWAKSHFVANLVGENASNRYVYTSFNGVPKLFLLTKNPSATAGDTIPFRKPNGRLGVGVPVDDVDAVPKSYFDTMKKDLTDLIASLTARVLKLEGYHIEGTLGLAYTLSADGTYYECTGIGTATDTDIVIASEIGGIPVKRIYKSAFKDNTSLTSIIIPDSVTSIQGNAFMRCSGLTSVTIGNGVTSINTSAFYYCTSLTSIIIPDSVTSIRSSAFDGCSGLTSVTIGNGIKIISNSAFLSCDALVDIYVPWAEGAISDAPWGATNATIHYNSEV